MGERFNKFKENCERKKRELYWKIHDTKEWVRNHPVESVWILSIGTGVVSAGVNGGIKLADRIYNRILELIISFLSLLFYFSFLLL